MGVGQSAELEEHLWSEDVGGWNGAVVDFGDVDEIEDWSIMSVVGQILIMGGDLTRISIFESRLA